MIKYITLHATMTPPDQMLTRRDLDRRDRNAGYSEIGCHYLITRAARLETGRSTHLPSPYQPPEGVPPGPAVLVVEMVGGVDPSGEPCNNFTSDQNKTLSDLLSGLMSNYPDAQVVPVDVFKLRPLQPDKG